MTDDDGAVAEAARDAALAVRGVTRLATGPFGEVATYLPGRRSVPGVRVRDDELHVHLVVAVDVPLRAVAADVHRAVGLVAGGRAVVVHVDDLDVGPAADLAAPPDQPSGGTGRRTPTNDPAGSAPQKE